MKYFALLLSFFLASSGQGAPSTFMMRPFVFGVPQPFDSVAAKAELKKNRSFSSQEKIISKNHFPKTCTALLAQWEIWITKVRTSAAGGKFAEIDYVNAVADCLAFRDLSRYSPSPTTLEEAAYQLAKGVGVLSGDFYPELPSAHTCYEHKVGNNSENGQVSLKIYLTYKDGTSEATVPNRTYYILATATDPNLDSDVWLAMEQEIPGNYGLCSYVQIAKSHSQKFYIRYRQELGRCA